ncbi:MAG: NADH-quinone oxidoreductase subunit M [Cytophagaceae bacterium]|jgi:NADH-quinone oxidoreductase subunit M|nr:NADH-quinone oxidoreductase subunit M [Cytophagaceae bacterium]
MNLLLLTILIPFVGGLVLLLLKGEAAKWISLAFSLLTLGAAVGMYQFFELNEQVQFVSNTVWMEALGLNFYFGADGISLVLVLLTTLLTPLIVLSAFGRNYSGVFLGLILLMESALVGVFTARDAFLFYVFWELALIPIYFICLYWGGENRGRITFKFFLYTLVGSLIMLMGVIYLYLQTEAQFGMASFAWEDISRLKLSTLEQSWLFWSFFAAFAIKMPVFPLHTWQPDTYTNAPAQGTMLLSGIMLKMGIYGVIRWMIPVLPEAMVEWAMLAVVLSVVGIVYASVIAIQQKEYKRLIAYSSIAHVGLIAAGIFTHSVHGIQGAMIQMLSHGVCAVGMFFVIDIIMQRTNTQQLESLGGIRNQAPVLTIFAVIVMLGSVSLPLTSGFVGEFILFVSVFEFNPYLAAVAGLTIILGAVYMLNSFQKSMLGEPRPEFASFKDLNWSEFAVLAVVSLLILYIGVYPKTFMELSEPSVKLMLGKYSGFTLN